MTDRDKLLLSIRSEIPGITEDCRSELESFQNKILRPILKLQNELTLQLLKSSKGFDRLDADDNYEIFTKQLSKFIAKNIKLKNEIVSFISAHFTSGEYAFYLLNKKEINKRILSMQLKRFNDELISDYRNNH